jgi:hypothetical protein
VRVAKRGERVRVQELLWKRLMGIDDGEVDVDAM